MRKLSNQPPNPLLQPSQQQLTIRDAFDPDDSETKHITNSTYWLNETTNGTQSQLFEFSSSNQNNTNTNKPAVALTTTTTTTTAIAAAKIDSKSSPQSSGESSSSSVANIIGKINLLPTKVNDSIFLNNIHNNSKLNKQQQQQPATTTTNLSNISNSNNNNSGVNNVYNTLTTSRYYYSNFNNLQSMSIVNGSSNLNVGIKGNKINAQQPVVKQNNNNNNNSSSNYIQQILNVKSKPVVYANGTAATSSTTISSYNYMNSSHNGSIFNKSYNNLMNNSLSSPSKNEVTISSHNALLNGKSGGGGYYKYLNGGGSTANLSATSQLSTTTTSKNKLNEPKFVDYKRKWSEILRKEKQKYENRWRVHAQRASAPMKLDEFEFRRTLGTGSFGRVILFKMKHQHQTAKTTKTTTSDETGGSSNQKEQQQQQQAKYYALKVLEKRNVMKTKQLEHTIYEKKILAAVSFPFIAALNSSYKDNSNLYLLLEFVSGGEMFAHLTRVGRFSEKLCKFYCAQVILAIEYLHSLDIIHRDLKPENTLIAADGYIKISDFGFAKCVRTRTYTLCGTPEYLAPEVIQSKPYGKPVDWWAVGILTYEISTGSPPFQSDQAVKIYEKILAGKYKIPSHLSDEIKDFMKCLIQQDVTKRYGNLRNGVDDIKTHKWLDSIDWLALYNKKLTAPMIPKLKNSGDTSNFDKYAECNDLVISKEPLYEKEFEDF